MKKLNKEEIKLIKNYITRKQDFPIYLDRDIFIQDLSGYGDFRFPNEYNGNIKDFNETFILAVTIMPNEKTKVNRLILSVYFLLKQANELELYDLSYNCNKFLVNINNAIDSLDKQNMDDLLNDFKSILNGN